MITQGHVEGTWGPVSLGSVLDVSFGRLRGLDLERKRGERSVQSAMPSSRLQQRALRQLNNEGDRLAPPRRRAGEMPMYARAVLDGRASGRRRIRCGCCAVDSMPRYAGAMILS